MADYEETFENADAGSSLTYPLSVGDVKKGGHMCIQGRPCKVKINS